MLNNLNLSDILFKKLLISIVTFSISGCGSNTPYLDSKFGNAVHDAVHNQSIDNNTNPTQIMNARELRMPVDNYLKGTSAPPALEGVGTTGSSGPATQ